MLQLSNAFRGKVSEPDSGGVLSIAGRLNVISLQVYVRLNLSEIRQGERGVRNGGPLARMEQQPGLCVHII